MNIVVCITVLSDVYRTFGDQIPVRDGQLAVAMTRAVSLSAESEREGAQGSIRCMAVGRESQTRLLRKALALGADAATHILIPDPGSHDATLGIQSLAGAIRRQDFDLVMMGTRERDTAGQIAAGMLAALLSIPYATNVSEVERDGSTIRVQRNGPDGAELVELPLPCLIAGRLDMSHPAIPTVRAIKAACEADLDVIKPDESPINPCRIQPADPSLQQRRATKLDGTPMDMAREICDILDLGTVSP